MSLDIKVSLLNYPFKLLPVNRKMAHKAPEQSVRSLVMQDVNTFDMFLIENRTEATSLCFE